MKRASKNSQSGIALFMVVSAIALLAVLVTELTYSSQMSSRMAYNYVDGLKAYYLAKAGYKISLLRLKAFSKIKDFVNNPSNKAIKDAVGAGTLEKIWSVPFFFPPPIPKDSSMAQSDAIKEFIKESKLSGTFTASIVGESARLNLNNLFIKEREAAQAASPSPSPSPSPAATAEPMDFAEALEPLLNSLVEQKEEDREFADVYRNVTGKDILDAIRAYLFADMPPSNLPGFKPIKPKQAPFYSLTELHLVPGIDDQLYDLITPSLTVYSTPGLNVNTLTKAMLRGLIPELTLEDADDVLRKRDDPDVGKPFSDEASFWNAIGETSAARTLESIKARFSKANIKLITEEQSFKISVLANVGMATRRLEAFVILGGAPSASKSANAPTTNPPGVTPAGQQPPSAADTATAPQDASSAKKNTGVNLIYWRMI